MACNTALQYKCNNNNEEFKIADLFVVIIAITDLFVPMHMCPHTFFDYVNQQNISFNKIITKVCQASIA